MINIIWGLIGPVVVNIALKVGLPKAIEWLLSKGLPQWLIDGLVSIIKGGLGEIQTVRSDENLSRKEKAVKIKAIRKEAKIKAKDHCTTGCSPDTKT